MLRALRDLIRGLKIGLREFHRSSEEIQDEMRDAMEVRPMDEADSRVMRNICVLCALLCYTIFWLTVFRSP